MVAYRAQLQMSVFTTLYDSIGGTAGTSSSAREDAPSRNPGGGCIIIQSGATSGGSASS